MNIYCVEWWYEREGKYEQEYFQCPIRAGQRTNMLIQDKVTDHVDLTTIHVDTELATSTI